jgi:zinc-ribbon domain
MKSCTYCGRENEDGITFCQECGTEIVAPVAKQPSRKPVDWTGLKYAVFGVGALFVVAVLYLLSLGPVVRWTGSQAVPVPVVTVTNGISQTLYATTMYPAWVDVAYYPALELLASDGGGGLGELYSRYIRWWEKPPKP